MKEMNSYCPFCGKVVDIMEAWSYGLHPVHEECVKINDIKFYNSVIEVRDKIYSKMDK
jgi:hypothetical protein